jgi:type IV pilus assembly protein PilA
MQMLRNRKGFTLIELLIVVVIIGILAAIAIPKFAATKDKAKLAAVKTDLRNMMTAQEAYWSDYNAYGAFTDLQTASNFALSDPVNSTMTITPNATGYDATETNSSITSTIKGCHVAVGGATTTGTDGVIICP